MNRAVGEGRSDVQSVVERIESAERAKDINWGRNHDVYVECWRLEADEQGVVLRNLWYGDGGEDPKH